MFRGRILHSELCWRLNIHKRGHGQKYQNREEGGGVTKEVVKEASAALAWAFLVLVVAVSLFALSLFFSRELQLFECSLKSILIHIFRKFHCEDRYYKIIFQETPNK
ncbi:hypothetical protein RIF29_20487 [Crotalaria pallida]|uniref:Uncharacterized protein n=1 Tax=Crotalaria pallida TaxID=3830 RepID=A0AAN9F5M2_CROPI